MNSFYYNNSIISILFNYFAPYFQHLGRLTRKNLIWLLIAMLTLESCCSIRRLFTNFLKNYNPVTLNCYYRLISTADLTNMPQKTLEKALSLISDTSAPIYLALDDTIISKVGKHFEKVKILFNHADHCGKPYVNGHCFVSLTLCIKVKNEYVAIPLGYKMWLNEKSKLEIAADFIDEIMPQLTGRKVILTFDAWYAKKELINRALQHKNLEIICNARSDTVMYELPPESTGKRGRPRKHGDKIVNFKGTTKVLTNIFGDRIVTANLCNKRLFFSTINDFSGYSQRWNIEVNYYEHKIFWSLGDYRVRSKQGIENLVNLINVAHASMKILPYVEPSLEKYQRLSAQQVRFHISEFVRSNLFFDSLALRAKTLIKSNRFMQELIELTQSIKFSA